MAKHVYFFGGKTADGNGKMKELLGGKGANLAEMCTIGIPVPPGFTITTEVCAAYYEQGKKIPEAAIPEINEALTSIRNRYDVTGTPLPSIGEVRSGWRLTFNTLRDGPRRHARRPGQQRGTPEDDPGARADGVCRTGRLR